MKIVFTDWNLVSYCHLFILHGPLSMCSFKTSFKYICRWSSGVSGRCKSYRDCLGYVIVERLVCLVKWLFLNHASECCSAKITSSVLSAQSTHDVSRQEKGVLFRTLQERPWLNVLLSAAAAMLSLKGNAQVLICKVEMYAEINLNVLSIIQLFIFLKQSFVFRSSNWTAMDGETDKNDAPNNNTGKSGLLLRSSLRVWG